MGDRCIMNILQDVEVPTSDFLPLSTSHLLVVARYAGEVYRVHTVKRDLSAVISTITLETTGLPYAYEVSNQYFSPVVMNGCIWFRYSYTSQRNRLVGFDLSNGDYVGYIDMPESSPTTTFTLLESRNYLYYVKTGYSAGNALVRYLKADGTTQLQNLGTWVAGTVNSTNRPLWNEDAGVFLINCDGDLRVVDFDNGGNNGKLYDAEEAFFPYMFSAPPTYRNTPINRNGIMLWMDDIYSCFASLDAQVSSLGAGGSMTGFSYRNSSSWSGDGDRSGFGSCTDGDNFYFINEQASADNEDFLIKLDEDGNYVGGVYNFGYGIPLSGGVTVAWD